MPKTDRDAASVAVSNEQPAGQPEPGQPATAVATRAPEQVITLGLSDQDLSRLNEQLAKTLHAIENGFDALTAPGDVFKMDLPFYVIDGILIEDFVDKKTGEEKAKCVFRFEFEDGRIVNVMQSAARPRKLIADACETARQLGGRYRAGPYKFIKKGVGQIQDAFILEMQPGWMQQVTR